MSHRPLHFLIRPGLLLTISAALAFAQHPSQSAMAGDVEPYKNPGLPIAQRVDDLVSRMTLEEKASQMVEDSKAIPRLGIPEYHWWSEGLHGLGFAGKATVFPQAIGVAASWDPDLLHRTADAIATEARAKYEEAAQTGYHGMNRGLTVWSPNINIFRDPRWGRGQETYGEDPFLTSRFGVAYVQGLQGDDPHYLKAISTPKHFAVHSGPELLRHVFDVQPSKHDLEDTYLPAFQASVEEGRAGSVMCSYNAVDGTPACASSTLLDQYLRKDWGFHGYVVSDCEAITDIWRGHHFTPESVSGAASALKAGTDLACGSEYLALPKAVAAGLVREADIDVAVKRLFTARFRLGMFDPSDRVPYTRIPITELASPEHRKLALQSARETMTLLKNSNAILPLQENVHTIAIVGPEADLTESLLGNYSGTPVDPVTPLAGVARSFAQRATLLYAQGSKIVAEQPVPVPASSLTPAKPDNTAIIGGLTGEYFDNEDFAGRPIRIRTDTSIDFNWAALDPVPGLKDGRFSVRWTGSFTPPAPGDYHFAVAVPGCYPCERADEFRFYLDGKLLSQRSGTPALPMPVQFKDASAHSIRLEYAHHGDGERSEILGGQHLAGITLLWDAPAEAQRSQAVAIASKADVVVAVLGITAALESEETPSLNIHGFRGGDRTDLALPGPQEELLEALGATGKPIIVVLMNGSALAVNWADAHAAAILEAWYPGEEGGTAIAETLAGSNNPAGRLPITFYKSVEQLPSFEDYSMANRTYRYFKGTPLYPFGHGLSYSRFSYSNLKLSNAHLHSGSSLDVDVDLRNTSQRAGDEVVQLYLSFPSSPAAPIRSLRAFSRVRTAAGQTQHVHFTLTPRDLSDVTATGQRVIAGGRYAVSVGGGQPGDTAATVQAAFSIDTTTSLPR